MRAYLLAPKLLKQILDRKDVAKSEHVHVITGLLKAYLRDLPGILLEFASMSDIQNHSFLMNFMVRVSQPHVCFPSIEIK